MFYIINKEGLFSESSYETVSKEIITNLNDVINKASDERILQQCSALKIKYMHLDKLITYINDIFDYFTKYKSLIKHVSKSKCTNDTFNESIKDGFNIQFIKDATSIYTKLGYKPMIYINGKPNNLDVIYETTDWNDRVYWRISNDTIPYPFKENKSPKQFNIKNKDDLRKIKNFFDNDPLEEYIKKTPNAPSFYINKWNLRDKYERWKTPEEKALCIYRYNLCWILLSILYVMEEDYYEFRNQTLSFSKLLRKAIPFMKNIF